MTRRSNKLNFSLFGAQLAHNEYYAKVQSIEILYMQWLKCKIRSGGTLHSGLGPWQWSYAFP